MIRTFCQWIQRKRTTTLDTIVTVSITKNQRKNREHQGRNAMPAPAHTNDLSITGASQVGTSPYHMQRMGARIVIFLIL